MPPEDAVVANLRSIAHAMAWRFAWAMPPSITMDDLEQEAAIAMLEVARAHSDESWQELEPLIWVAVRRRMGEILRWTRRECRDGERVKVMNVERLYALPVDLDTQVDVARQISRLPERDQQLLYRRYWLGEDWNEMAPPGEKAANVRRRRATPALDIALMHCRWLAGWRGSKLKARPWLAVTFSRV